MKILLSLLSGTLICLSFPKWNLWFLAWVALVPMFLAIEGLRLKQRFWTGWLAGWCAFCGILYWIVPTFQAAGVSTLVGILATALLAGYIGIYYGLYAALSEKFFKRLPVQICLFLNAALWISFEYLRGRLFTGFPWGTLGYSQTHFYSLIQISEFTGVYGVSFLIILINNLIASLIRSFANKSFSLQTLRICLFPAFLVLTSMLYGTFHLKIEDSTNPHSRAALSVTVLQGNISQYKKWSPEYVKEILNTYEQLATQQTHTDLMVWPETAAPGWIPQDGWLMQWLQNTVRKTKSYNLIGAVTQYEKNNYNSAILFDLNGNSVGRYDKIHLVPFGEFVPLQSLLGKWIPVLNQLGGFSSGGKTKILQIPNADLGVSICYEVIFPELIRKQVLEGAEVLVNVTNDGWYLDTAAPEQHFSMNRFRAIENRRFMIRSANTGISGVIQPNGMAQKMSELNVQTVLDGSVRPLRNKTFYTRYGDLFAWLCGLISVVGMIIPSPCKGEGEGED